MSDMPTSGAQDHESHWEIYPCWIGEAYGLVRVDIAWFDPAPLATHATGIDVSMVLQSPRDDGMPQGDEYEVMNDVEAAIESAAPDAIFIGATVAGGVRHWYLCSADPVADEQAIVAATRSVAPTHELATRSYDDAGWEQYFDFLYPNSLAWQYIQDQRLLGHMRESLGDDGSAPRIVSHWAYFPTRRARRAFIKQVKEMDYTIQGKSTHRDKTDERYALHFDTLYEIAPKDITPHTERLVQAATACEGRYDGWEVPVITGDTPPAP